MPEKNFSDYIRLAYFIPHLSFYFPSRTRVELANFATETNSFLTFFFLVRESRSGRASILRDHKKM